MYACVSMLLSDEVRHAMPAMNWYSTASAENLYSVVHSLDVETVRFKIMLSVVDLSLCADHTIGNGVAE